MEDNMAKFKRILLRLLYYPYALFKFLLFDPMEKVYMLMALPYFAKNLLSYLYLTDDTPFKIHIKNIRYYTFDRFKPAGTISGDYFYQDLWAAQNLFQKGVTMHVDIGSRLDGFIAHILTFCQVTYVDLRPVELNLDNFKFKQGSILRLPFDDNSLTSVSCLHVIEHIGLGRYGDPIDPDGFLKAAKELTRVITSGGILLIGTPVGQERLYFDAHRVFDPQTIVDAFKPLQLEDFRLIDNNGDLRPKGASFEDARNCRYGCGLFNFVKY